MAEHTRAQKDDVLAMAAFLDRTGWVATTFKAAAMLRAYADLLGRPECPTCHQPDEHADAISLADQVTASVMGVGIYEPEQVLARVDDLHAEIAQLTAERDKARNAHDVLCPYNKALADERRKVRDLATEFRKYVTDAHAGKVSAARRGDAIGEDVLAVEATAYKHAADALDALLASTTPAGETT